MRASRRLLRSKTRYVRGSDSRSLHAFAKCSSLAAEWKGKQSNLLFAVRREDGKLDRVALGWLSWPSGDFLYLVSLPSGGIPMVQAFSRLNHLLGEHNWTVPELHRRLRARGLRVNLKSLYRLKDDHRPLERLDLRVAGAVCQVFQVSLSALITFAEAGAKLRRLRLARQRRLEILMARNNDCRLSAAERAELGELVREAEAITLHNARVLAGRRVHASTP